MGKRHAWIITRLSSMDASGESFWRGIRGVKRSRVLFLAIDLCFGKSHYYVRLPPTLNSVYTTHLVLTSYACVLRTELTHPFRQA